MLSRTVIKSLRPSAFLRAASSFTHKDLIVTKAKTLKQHPDPKTLGFGHCFTDHMLEVNYHEGNWSKPEILPYSDFHLDPASSVFHYGLCCFEGLKAYRDRNGKIRMFRPMKNMERFNKSMARLCMQPIPETEYLECIKELIRLDSAWVPDDPTCSLYIRPCCIGTEPALGVHASKNFKVFTILSPSGPYYKTGMKPIKIVAESHYTRAWPGGIGFTKAGGNYAPTMYPAELAEKKGYSQILWLLDGNITEGGAMNIMVYLTNEQGEDEVVTAPLDGTILPGVTRDSVLQILRKWNNCKVSERKMHISEICKAAEEKRLKEVFCSGTAAVLTPINCIAFEGKEYHTTSGDETGELTNKLYQYLTGIQRGVVPNPFPNDPWSIVI